MFSRFPELASGSWSGRPGCLFAAAAVMVGSVHAQPSAGTAATTTDATNPRPPGLLRVCADPNNLPFSNAKEAGFENRIAQVLARELGLTLRYTWFAQRRGFLRNTLHARECDLVMGLPHGFELAATTAPYYRSSYVFVTRTSEGLRLQSLDDDALHPLRIGVHLVGDDYNNTPPAHALARRGMSANVRGYMLYGDYREPDPPARILEALARKEIDVAIVWGPLAGYFASRLPVPLSLTPVSPAQDQGLLPMQFDIALGVRRGEPQWMARLEAAMQARQAEIAQILAEYQVPLIPVQTAAAAAGKEERQR